MFKVRKPPRGGAKTAATLADVQAAVAASDTLTPVRIRDLVSAIACFCRLVEEIPEHFPLDLAMIRKRLNAINPNAVEISAKRLANIRSDLLAAIAASGLKPIVPARKELAAPWQVLRTKLESKRHRIGLSRLAHYASTVGVAPADVDDNTIDAFIAWVRDTTLHPKPNDLHRQTAVIWNEIVAELPAFELRPVSVPSYRTPPQRVDWSSLAQRFIDDVEAYLDWCACTDPFAPDARARPLAPATVKLRLAEIHAAVTALVEGGVESATLTGLADLVTSDNFKTIAKRRRDMADGEENAFNKQLVNALVQIAREWVKVDDATLTELKRLAGKLPALRGDLTRKNKSFLRQFDDPAVLHRLRRLPTVLWSQVRRNKTPVFQRLALVQTALAVEILTYMPLRMRNLAGLVFDEHLFLRDGPGAVSSLEISADEVKNKHPIAFDIPPHIARMLIEYRDEIAPKIIGTKPTHVFVNPDRTPKLPQTVSKLIKRVVRKQTGVDLSPHQFRHLAAKILLDDSPGAFELVKQLLGHQNLKTTANFYAGIDTRRASRHHHALLERWSKEHALTRSTSGRRRKTKNSKKKNKMD